MKLVIQRVTHGSVTIDGKINGEIDKGYVVLVGFGVEDTEDLLEPMIDKMINLRIFEDENGKMNKSLLDVNGSILSISQFTLYANCRHGRRPGFTDAMHPTYAIPMYDKFNQMIKDKGVHIETGIFGADMKVSIMNDGPVTIILDSDKDISKKG